MGHTLKFHYSPELGPVRDLIQKNGWPLLTRGRELAAHCWDATSVSGALEAVTAVYEESDRMLLRYPADAIYAALEPAYIAACDAMAAIEKQLTSTEARDCLKEAAELLGAKTSALRAQTFGKRVKLS